MARLTEDKLLEQIDKLRGNISAVARAFGVTRAAVQDYISKRPHLQDALRDAREAMVDNVESRFYADCLKDDPAYQTTRIFFLKTQGKHRGWVERIETREVVDPTDSMTDAELDAEIERLKAETGRTARRKNPPSGAK